MFQFNPDLFVDDENTLDYTTMAPDTEDEEVRGE